MINVPVYGKRILILGEQKTFLFYMKTVNKKVQAQNISVRPENVLRSPWNIEF